MTKNITPFEYAPVIFLIIYFVLKHLNKIPGYDKEIAIIIFFYYYFIKPKYALFFLLLALSYFLIIYNDLVQPLLTTYNPLFENFGNNDKINTDKTIYFVWGSKKDGNEHGLGDKLRCLNYLYRYCNKNNIRLIFDCHQHEIGDYLKNSKADNWEEIENQEVVFMKHDMKIPDAEKYLKEELDKKKTIYIYAAMADMPDFKDKDGIDFMKYVLEPSDKFTIELNNKKKQLPENYTIQHVRFDDTVFTDDTDKKGAFDKFFKMVNDSYSSTDVLISNSKEFKKYVKGKLPIYTIECGENECTTAHMAGVGAYPGDKDSYKNTLIDFYVMCGSKRINTYSQYGWISNFANWASKLYDIPLVNIQGLREWS